MWLPFASLHVSVIRACSTSFTDPSPELSICSAPGVPSRSYADVSRSPRARSMLLKLLTQRSSQPEVSAAHVHCVDSLYSQGARWLYAKWKLTTVGCCPRCCNCSAKSVRLQARWFISLRAVSQAFCPILVSRDSWKAGGHLAERCCCSWRFSARFSELQQLSATIFGLLWLQLISHKGLDVHQLDL